MEDRQSLFTNGKRFMEKHLKTKLHTKTLGDQLREDQEQLKRERMELLLKVLCVILTIGYLTWITIDLISS